MPLPSALVPFVCQGIENKRRSELVVTGPRGGRLTASNVRRFVDGDAFGHDPIALT